MIEPDDTRARLDAYLTDLFAREDEVLRRVQAEAQRNGMPSISLSPFEARLLQFLVSAIGAKKIVEIGTLAGYSAIWMARALPPDGRLYTLERSGKHAQVARASFQRAGLADRIELLEGEADISLERLSARAPFDLVFIDADKPGYPAYLEWAVVHLRPGGLVTAHNALLGGRVLDPQTTADQAMHAFNRTLAEHPQLDSLIFPFGDGLAVGIKRSAAG
jgi:caffeoyl-CoA O-methyltransferase